MDEAARARALDAWRTVMGSEAPPAADMFMALTLDHVVGGIWTRPGLSHRDRRLVTITAAAMGAQREALAAHLRAGLATGAFTADELHEWVVHLAHYGGWPVAAGAYLTLRDIQAQVEAESAAPGD